MTDTPGKLEERLRATVRIVKDADSGKSYKRLRNPDGPEAADEISSLRARVEELETAGRYIKPYLVWTVGSESPGYHPTMPSAVGAFLDTLAR